MNVSVRRAGVYEFGPFRLDPDRRTLLRHGERVKLAEKQFDILHALAAHAGQAIDRETLLRTIWRGRVVDENNLNQAVFAIRKVLHADADSAEYIVTVPGRGYRFAVPVDFLAHPDDTMQPASQAEAFLSNTPPPPAPWPFRLSHAAIALAGIALLVALFGAFDRPAGRPDQQADPSGATAFSPPAHALAVLAFDNMTGDSRLSYISDGLSEELIDRLSAVDGLHVAARASAFSFRGTDLPAATIAQRLNVGALLQGSLRRDGTHLRITAQLVNAMTGYIFWSKSFDRAGDDVLSVESDIAHAVAQSLKASLLGGGSAGMDLGGTTNPKAFDAYLHAARMQADARAPADYQAALAAFETALAIDPGFARAYAAKAFILARLGEIGAVEDQNERRTQFSRARQAADRAVALAPALGAAHSVRGLVLGWGFLDRAGAEAEQQKAEALSPGDAIIERNYANAEAALGHTREAVAALLRAVRLDPVSPDAWAGLARGYYFDRRYGDAREALRHAGALSPEPPVRAKYLLGQIELMRHDPDAARQACAAGASWQENEVLAIAYHALGRQPEAQAQLAQLQARLKDGGAYNFAVVYAQWGDTGQALHWLSEAVRLQDPGLAFVHVDPMLDSIRGKAQFAALAQPVP